MYFKSSFYCLILCFLSLNFYELKILINSMIWNRKGMSSYDVAYNKSFWHNFSLNYGLDYIKKIQKKLNLALEFQIKLNSSILINII